MRTIRILIGGFGGYLLASLAIVTLTLALPFSSKPDAIVFASLLSYSIWLCFILYAFSSVSLKSLLLQLTFICINLFLINTCLSAIKG